MTVVTPKPAVSAAQDTPAPIPVRQAEPKTGGSYSRNPVDGTLVKNPVPAPATQPNKE
ncbi:hypothetical protein V3C40_01075 [Janthinobacterium sp. LS2A]|uniref:hypothetical protein n=1 Tax=Janthinobacterium sp. LS2A TaxID=3118590 RepID=UPI002F92996A